MTTLIAGETLPQADRRPAPAIDCEAPRSGKQPGKHHVDAIMEKSAAVGEQKMLTKLNTTEQCLEHAEKCILEGLPSQAGVLVEMAKVRAYQERTNLIGEVTGWKAGGTFDQYLERLREAIAGQRGMSAEEIWRMAEEPGPG
jgi:hypothetical protein